MSFPLPEHVPYPDSVVATAWWAAMKQCAQDPTQHPEGDVATHTRLVYEALVGNPVYRDLDERRRGVLAWAVLLHDVGKPQTSKLIDGAIRAPHHSTRGAVMARRILWEADLPYDVREEVAHLVRMHMRPAHLMDKDDIVREMITFSHHCEVRLLSLLAWADAQGRGVGIRPSTRDRLEVFDDYAKEMGVWLTPWPFADDESRFQYARTPGRDPHYAAVHPRSFRAILMSGLPGAGKSSWAARQGVPVLSLDALRDQIGYPRGRTDGALLARAKEEIKRMLRNRQSFVWDTTGLDRQGRQRFVGQAAEYGAVTQIVTIEGSPALVRSRNTSRPESHVVPEHAFERFLNRWEAPTAWESHHLDVVYSE